MELILITNDIDVAKYAEECGVDRIMVDIEWIGKKERQGHLNTVISGHTINDVYKVRKVISTAKLMVRINPIHNNSYIEISEVINAGAEILMLPMFKYKEEVEYFIDIVGNKAVKNLLLETPQAVVRINNILSISNIDEIYIGLNDLHIGMGLDFLFELLSGGIVEYLVEKFKNKNIKYGFGGISRLGCGLVDSALILSEHYRLNSKMVILSRDFKGYVENYSELREKIDLKQEIQKIRGYLEYLKNLSYDELLANKNELIKKVNEVVTEIRKKKSIPFFSNK